MAEEMEGRRAVDRLRRRVGVGVEHGRSRRDDRYKLLRRGRWARGRSLNGSAAAAARGEVQGVDSLSSITDTYDSQRWLLLLSNCSQRPRRRSPARPAGSRPHRQSSRRPATWCVPRRRRDGSDLEASRADKTPFVRHRPDLQFQQAANAFKIEKNWDSSGRAFDRCGPLASEELISRERERRGGGRLRRRRLQHEEEATAAAWPEATWIGWLGVSRSTPPGGRVGVGPS